ncbi:hypothetical protein [Kaarinaea lacus]
MIKKIYLVMLGSLLIATGCSNSDPVANSESCSTDEQSVTSSDQRTLCIALATSAQTPFATGFVAPARVTHLITIKDADGNPVDIASDAVIEGISQHPMMYMNNGHDHTTPHSHEPDASRSDEGIYTFPVYYSMVSMMADGTSMGDWEYAISLTDTGATEPLQVVFHPEVRMVMGGNIFAAKGSNDMDQWTNMMDMTKPRSYTIWLEAISASPNNGYDLTLFVSTQDMMHMNTGGHAHTLFPAVYSTQMLHGPVPAGGGMQMTVTLDMVTVEISTDAGNTWQSLSATDHGYYSGSGLAGFAAGEQVSPAIRLTVNGLEMTTAAGTSPQLMFTVPN